MRGTFFAGSHNKDDSVLGSLYQILTLQNEKEKQTALNPKR